MRGREEAVEVLRKIAKDNGTILEKSDWEQVTLSRWSNLHFTGLTSCLLKPHDVMPYTYQPQTALDYNTAV